MSAPVSLPEGEGVAAVEALGKRLQTSPLYWGTHADRWKDDEWQTKYWQEVASVVLASDWLVEHDRAVRESAWDEGWDARNDDYWSGDRNPYQPEASA